MLGQGNDWMGDRGPCPRQDEREDTRWERERGRRWMDSGLGGVEVKEVDRGSREE